MTNTNFLTHTNSVLRALNEVQLTSSNFSTVTGFPVEAQNAVNQAIFDIYARHDDEWPFLWSSTTFNTVKGQTDYTRSDNFTSLNWDSFAVQRIKPTISSITQTGGIATATTSAAHNLLTADIVTISGAAQSAYNISGAITVTGTTTFTFPVDASTVSPATGTILCFCENVLQTKLQLRSWDQYLDDKTSWQKDQNTDPSGYTLPKYAVRKPDNNIYIDGPCDRVYTIYYEGFQMPAALSAYSDTSLIPPAFDSVIKDKALHYCYMFREDLASAEIAEQRYENNLFQMRRILIPQEPYAVATE